MSKVKKIFISIFGLLVLLPMETLNRPFRIAKQVFKIHMINKNRFLTLFGAIFLIFFIYRRAKILRNKSDLIAANF